MDPVLPVLITAITGLLIAVGAGIWRLVERYDKRHSAAAPVVGVPPDVSLSAAQQEHIDDLQATIADLREQLRAVSAQRDRALGIQREEG